MAITAQKLLPSSKSGGAIAPIKTGAITKITPITLRKKKGGGDQEKDTLLVIKERCIEIETLLKGSLTLDKMRAEQRRKSKQEQSRTKKEEDLEKGSDDEDKKKEKSAKLPKISFFDRIKNFIKNVLLGFVITRLLEFAPQIAEFLSLASPVAKFIGNVGKFLLEGLVNLVDFGYQVYDSARQFVGDKLGDKALENFDKLSSAVNTMLNLALIGAMGVLAFRQKEPKKPKPDASSGGKPRRNQIVDPSTGKIRKKTKFELELQKKYKLNDDQINAFRKAKQGGANTQQALTQAKKVKPKPKKPQGFFGKLFEGAKDLASKVGSGLNKISGGNLGKLGNFLQDQYKNASAAVRKQYDKVVAVGDLLKSKFGEGVNKLKSAAGNLAEAAKKQIVQKIIEPLKPFFEPILSKLKGVSDKIMKQLSKIPGFDNVMKVLQKNGISGLADAKGLLKKIGPKAIPILGGIVNLLFAYDRLAQGDIIGGLLEATSGVLDVSGAFGFAPGPGISMAMDAYLFARDFIPQIQDGENAVVNSLGLGGIKGQVEGLAKKLPDLSTLVKMITGGEPNKPMIGLGQGQAPAGGGSTTSPTNVTRSNIQASNDIVKVGKDLIAEGFSVAEHPDFTKTPTASGGSYTPDAGSVSNVHQGRGHYESRAIDVTDWRGTLEDSKARYRGVLDSIYNNGNMAKDMLLIHDSWGAADKTGKSGPGSHAHPEHMHIEVKDLGGLIGKGLFANLGKPEFVLDADSTAAIEKAVPGLLNAINKADGKSAVDALRKYASYDLPEMIPIPVPQPVQNVMGAYEKTKKAAVNIISGGMDSFQEILYMR